MSSESGPQPPKDRDRWEILEEMVQHQLRTRMKLASIYAAMIGPPENGEVLRNEGAIQDLIAIQNFMGKHSK